MEVLAFSYFVAPPTPYEVVKLCVRFPFFNESGWHESNVRFSIEPGPKPGGQPLSHIQLKMVVFDWSLPNQHRFPHEESTETSVTKSQ